MSIEQQARRANSQINWDSLWHAQDTTNWRADAMAEVYDRIVHLLDFERVPVSTPVIDIGGGVGFLAFQIIGTKRFATVWDHSPVALRKIPAGVGARRINLETDDLPRVDGSLVIGTELLEHLTEDRRQLLLRHVAASGCQSIWSVPNNRLGPDEEPQHTIKFTPLAFKQYLHGFFDHVRVEVHGAYLLGVCGFDKGYTLTVTMPARDEAADLDRTLASFRGVADRMIIGIDPRTEDDSAEVAKKYAEVVFELEEPNKDMPDGGVNFAWIRNQCMDRCKTDWIFMTEAHESLDEGQDVLLAMVRMNRLPVGMKIGYVMRTGNGQRWAFPWLCVNDPKVRYKRAVHNILDFPKGYGCVKFPQIVTLHERVVERSEARAEQRQVQNRTHLMEDWVINQNENSLFYLGQEIRMEDPERAIGYLEKFLWGKKPSKVGPSRYQARLMLAKLYAQKKDRRKTRDVLINATNDDWSRIEHWIFLGDMAFDDKQYEQALQFYKYAGTLVGEPPFTLWWIDLSMYGYLTAQRLAMAFAEVERYSDSLYWAEKVLELLPDDSPEEAIDEARKNVAYLKEATGNDELS
jgi:hypothetical protein